MVKVQRLLRPEVNRVNRQEASNSLLLALFPGTTFWLGQAERRQRKSTLGQSPTQQRRRIEHQLSGNRQEASP